MADAEEEIRRVCRGPSHRGIPVVVQVGVIDADELHSEVTDVEHGAGIVEVVPPGRAESGDEFLGRQATRLAEAFAVIGGEVTRGVLGRRREVVVGPENEDAGELEQPAERRECGGDRAQISEVVASVDDEVRAQIGEPLHPLNLAGLSRHQVHVADLHDHYRLRACGQDRQGEPPDDEGIALDAGRIAETGETRPRDHCGGAYERVHRDSLADHRHGRPNSADENELSRAATLEI